MNHKRLPRQHDIDLYLQIQDFREAYETAVPPGERCAGYDELLMSVYDKVVKTWNTTYENTTYENTNKASSYHVPRTSSECHRPLVVCEPMTDRIKKNHNFKTGDKFLSMYDMAEKGKIKNLSMIRKWKYMGYIRILYNE